MGKHPTAQDQINLFLREAHAGWREITQGKTNEEIGDILGCSRRTVQKHLERIYIKLGVENRTGAATLATEATRTFASPTAQARSCTAHISRKGLPPVETDPLTDTALH